MSLHSLQHQEIRFVSLAEEEGGYRINDGRDFDVALLQLGTCKHEYVDQFCKQKVDKNPTRDEINSR